MSVVRPGLGGAGWSAEPRAVTTFLLREEDCGAAERGTGMFSLSDAGTGRQDGYISTQCGYIFCYDAIIAYTCTHIVGQNAIGNKVI